MSAVRQYGIYISIHWAHVDRFAGDAMMQTKQQPEPAMEPLMDRHEKPNQDSDLEMKAQARRKLEDGFVNPRDGRGPLRRSDSQAH
jgi:hypothetical protein